MSKVTDKYVPASQVEVRECEDKVRLNRRHPMRRTPSRLCRCGNGATCMLGSSRRQASEWRAAVGPSRRGGGRIFHHFHFFFLAAR